ncbi:MAG TPA: hypothetical protein VHF01_08610 [Candidatus Acidoferrum sp.]|nr:hypothetical protein [Candidatus Acidoferrum sp.]
MAGKKTIFPGDWLSLLLLSALLLMAGGGAVAQEESKRGNLPDAPTAKQSDTHPTQKPENTRLKTTLEILGKRSLFFPELATDKGPLSSGQKFELAVDESIAPSRFLASSFTAGIAQARNALPGYGQEWGGYGKRFGSSMASGASSHLFGTFLLPAMLRQDPRYFVKLHGTVRQRVGYALRRILVTRTDRGQEVFNWSGVIGALLAESLANSYLPDGERTTGKTFTRFGFRMGFSAASNIVKEYWPTIFKSLRISKLVPNERSDPGTVTPPTPSGPPPKP